MIVIKTSKWDKTKQLVYQLQFEISEKLHMMKTN